jgi:acetylornithine deacetylase/succinyl-diaminopimelate desuccinylase-like protein
VKGFYDRVRKISTLERRELKRLPHSEAGYRKMVGVPELFGESGFSTMERRTVRPTLEINGITSGYQGEGSKTIVPAWARAKLTLRLVPDQDPATVLEQVTSELKRLCPRSVRLEIHGGHGAEPYLTPPNGALARAGLRALELGFARKPLLLREGGSIPIVSEFRKVLGVDSLLLGLALPDANAHAPNESFHLGALRAGMRMSAHLWPALAAACA